MTSIFYGQNPRFINADLCHMEAARSQLEMAIGAVTALMKERAILTPTKGVLDDLINGIIDVKSDLSHAIACAEDAATLKAAE